MATRKPGIDLKCEAETATRRSEDIHGLVRSPLATCFVVHVASMAFSLTTHVAGPHMHHFQQCLTLLLRLWMSSLLLVLLCSYASRGSPSSSCCYEDARANVNEHLWQGDRQLQRLTPVRSRSRRDLALSCSSVDGVRAELYLPLLFTLTIRQRKVDHCRCQ